MEEHIHKYFRHELTPKQRLALLRLVDKDEQTRELFIRIKNIYALSTLAEIEGQEAEGKESYRRFINHARRASIFHIIRRAGSYAAMALLLIGMTYWFTLKLVEKDHTEDLLTLHVPAGQRFRLTLQDGTQVWLNAGTSITYPTSFSRNDRRVSIDGEALFEVSTDLQRPFIVSSRGVNMKVLGTRFNVYAYASSDYMQASLLEGSLKVYWDDLENGGIVLSPNQQVTIKGDKMYAGRIQDLDYFLWTEGIYSANNEPLVSILQKLERYFDVKIEIADPSIHDWEYTGKFRQNDGIDEILRIIQKIHKFKITKDEENNTIVLS